MAEKHAGKFVACYRVSTQRQGRSGLGLSERTKAALASAKVWGNKLVGVRSADRTWSCEQAKTIHGLRIAPHDSIGAAVVSCDRTR
jgi:hypothetical protein